jgi:protein RecA
MVIFINQIRMKIGVMYGSPETTTGGNALKFYASVRLDIRRIGSIKDHDEVTGNQTRVKVVKNKVAPPFKQVEFDIMYGEGISKIGELIDLGVKAGVVEKSGDRPGAAPRQIDRSFPRRFASTSRVTHDWRPVGVKSPRLRFLCVERILLFN